MFLDIYFLNHVMLLLKVWTFSSVYNSQHVFAFAGDFQEKMSPGTTSIQATTPQSSEQLDPSQSDLITHAVTEAEAAEADEDVKMTVEALKDVDPLDKFLPPPTKAKCSDELQVSSSFRRASKIWLLLKASTSHRF